jgi:putative ABC transport system permease protein
VTAAYFDVLRISPAIGRTFRPEEDVPNGPRVVLLGHGLWQRCFGGDPTIVGRSILLSEEPHTIVGVLPPDFRPAVVSSAEIFRPLRLDLASPARGDVVLRVVARLKDGLAFDQARARAAVLAHRLESEHPRTNRSARINLVALHQQLAGDTQTGLLVLLGAVCLLQLLACANVANLFLARALARHREMAVRLALGASRLRLIRQLLAESLLLSLAAGGLGVLIAAWSAQAMGGLIPEVVLRFGDPSLDARVLAFALALSCATAVLFGIVPALRVSARRESSALKDSQRSVASSGSLLRRSLVVAEMGLAVILLAGAGLLFRSFLKMQAFDLGFDSEHTVIAQVVPSPVKYHEPAQLTALYDRLLERAAALPGVQVAALSSVVPLSGDTDMAFAIEGRPAAGNADDRTVAWYRLVSDGYFRAMGIPIVAGRAFETAEPAPVVVINQSMARRYWPGENPIGKRLRDTGGDRWFTVVGVARDLRSRGPTVAPVVEVYVPYRFLPERGVWIVLRTHPPAGFAGARRAGVAAEPASLAGPLREAVREVDASLPVSELAPMRQLLADQLAEPRFLSTLASLFGGLAMLLAACGIYGVMAYTVSQRIVELGVRVALGARQNDIFRLVVGQALRLTLAGVVIGSATAFAASHLLKSLLFEVAPGDPVTFVGAVTLLLVVALLACYTPARRAARLDPLLALRAE